MLKKYASALTCTAMLAVGGALDLVTLPAPAEAQRTPVCTGRGPRPEGSKDLSRVPEAVLRLARQTARREGVEIRTVSTEREREGLVYEFQGIRRDCFIEIDVLRRGGRVVVEEIEEEIPVNRIPRKVLRTLRLLPPLKISFVEKSTRPLADPGRGSEVFYEIEGTFRGLETTFEATIPENGERLVLEIAT